MPQDSNVERPELTRGELCAEIAAVLCIGVFPHLWGAIEHFLGPDEPRTATVFSLRHLALGTCIIVAVLYVMSRGVMSRGGAAWTRFGVVRPRLVDVAVGAIALVLQVGATHVGGFLFQHVPDVAQHDQHHPVPATAAQHALLLVAVAVSAFSEELVCRAYLITRLEQLLGSGPLAALISAVLFASYHVYQGFVSALVILLWALVSSFMFLFVPRIWPYVLAHFLWFVVVIGP